MLSGLKSVFGLRRSAPVRAAPTRATDSAHGALSKWAGTHGFDFAGRSEGIRYSLKGQVRGLPLRMEVGSSSRKYISGDELRGRADLGADPQVAVMLITRPLRNTLERQIYARYTDGLQTSVDASLPEEMRWLAAYQEFVWSSAPRQFWDRFSMVADRQEHALAWMNAGLIQQLLDWPATAPAESIPLVLMLLRGKAYLRMQHEPGGTTGLQHAASFFTSACEGALSAFKPLKS